MTRLRKHDTGLPPCVYFKHGAYYLVKGGVWTRLTANRDDVERLAASVPLQIPSSKKDLADHVIKKVATLKSSAKSRHGGAGIVVSLTRQDAIDLLHDCNWKCSVTRSPFSLQSAGKGRQRPFAPSIDRIDSAKGYTRDNCRIVCTAANFAMGSWGDLVLRAMTRNMRGSKVADILDSGLI